MESALKYLHICINIDIKYKITMKNINNLIIIALIGLIAVLMGKIVSESPMGMPLYSIVSLTVIVISIVNIRFALGLLIMSMLLSPEISLGVLSPDRSVVIRFDDLILILVFLVWFLKMALNKKLPLIKSTPINKYIYYYLAACFIFTTKGIIVGDVRFKRAMFYLLKYTEYFILFWMSANIIENKKDMKMLMVFATLTAFAVIGYGYTKMGTVVAAPFDAEPGSLGGYLILVVSVALGTVIYNKSIYLRLLAVALFLMPIPLIIVAKSRATYIAYVVMYISFIFLTKKYRKRLVLGAVLIVCLVPVISSGNLYRTLRERVTYTFSGSYGRFGIESSGEARLVTWKNKMRNYWTKKPFIGWGITGVGFIDSQYVRTIIELGVIGMSAFLLLLFKIFTESRKIFKEIEYGWAKGITIGFMAGYIGLLSHAITTNTFIIVRIMEPFWFLLAIVLTLPKLQESI